MANSFTAPDLGEQLSRVQRDIDDTQFVLGNTRSELPHLYTRLDASEHARQTVLTDSDSDEDETEEMRNAQRSAMLRGTIRQRKSEIDDSTRHLDTAKDYKDLVVVAQSKRKRPLDDKDRRDAFKRVVDHSYKPRSYGFDDDDDIPDFSGAGEWKSYYAKVSGGGLLDDFNPFVKTTPHEEWHG